MSERRQATLRFALAAAAIGVTGLYLAVFIANASYTLGFDYLAYDLAARRVLGGGPVYDPSFTSTRIFGLFYYPPTFLPLLVPFTLVPPEIGGAAWIAAMAACCVLAILAFPVRIEVRWITIALFGMAWPLIFAVKVGSVGPLLLLLFALGWRWLDRPGVLGALAALGALIKLQPGLLFGWFALRRRWRDLVVGTLIGLAVVVVTTTWLGVDAWFDFLRIFRALQDPLSEGSNFAPGAVAYGLGLGREAAGIVQILATLAVVLIAIAASRRLSSEASYLVAVIASQLVSPILWDHYALMLALPIAWMLERRRWWVVLIPLSHSVPIFLALPPIGWLGGWVVLLAGVVLVARKDGLRPAPTAGLMPPARVGAA